MNTTAVLRGLATLMVVALTTVGCAGSAKDNGGKTSSDAPYVVGAVLSVTGAQSGLGEPEKRAIEMEVARINAAGGINGHPLEVIVEDDGSDVDKATAATTKLIEQDRVLAIIGSTGTGQSMAMREQVVSAQVAQVSLGSGTAITSDVEPYVFQTTWTAKLVVPLMLEYLKDEGYTRVALITEDTGFGKDGKAAINQLAGEYGLKIVSDQVFKPSDTDMTGQLTVIRASGAEVVLMYSSVAASAIVPKNMRQLNMDIPLVCSHGNAKQEFIDTAGDAANGVVCFAGKVLAPETYGVDSEQYTVATGFVDRFTKAYGVAPDHYAGHAYDGLAIVVEAMKRLPEGFSAADLRDQIEKTNGLPGIGGVFTFSPTDHNGMTKEDIVRYRAQGGKWVLDQ